MSLNDLFDPKLKRITQKHVQVYACYEVIFTLVDFAAAFLFIVGSILFFKQSTTYLATWCFLIGSICFALKPTTRIVREFHLLRLGNTEELAAKASE